MNAKVLLFRFIEVDLYISNLGGNPDANGIRDYDVINGYKTYTSGEPDKYRLGALFVSWNGMRAGYNSESIRHQAQNRFAHDFLSNGQSKPQGPWHFRQLHDKFPSRFYGGFYSQNPFTTW